MATTADSLEIILGELREEMRALRREVAELRRRRVNTDARLLTKVAAARMLGVDRSTTLEELIRDGALRPVTIKGRERIPATEVERVLAGGVTRTGKRSHKRKAPAGEAAAQIRALKIT